MWSYPNLIPLSAAKVQRIAEILEPFAFDAVYGAIMDNFLSLSISLGIAAFGLWAIVTVESLPCTVLAPLPIIVGLISLYGAVREAKAGRNNTLPRQRSSSRRPF